MDDELVLQSRSLAERLQAEGLMMATAESCTGGWVAKLMTDIAGSSAWFDCAFVTYSNRSKQQMVGVQEETLSRYGAVSEAVVTEMVAGVLAHSQADLVVSVSGIAGPGGGSVEKPVGTVWFAWQRRDLMPVTACHHFEGDRDQVRRQAVAMALRGLRALLP